MKKRWSVTAGTAQAVQQCSHNFFLTNAFQYDLAKDFM